MTSIVESLSTISCRPIRQPPEGDITRCNLHWRSLGIIPDDYDKLSVCVIINLDSKIVDIQCVSFLVTALCRFQRGIAQLAVAKVMGCHLFSIQAIRQG